MNLKKEKEVGKSRGCIFVVDDEITIVDAIEALFNCCGFEIIKATNAKRALELSNQIRPDLIITDIQMPKLDGINFIKNFKQQQPNVKVIVITGYYPAYEQRIKDIQSSGLVERVLKKPVLAPDLQKIVYEILKMDESEIKQDPRGKILIVDDEKEVTEILKEHCRENGYAATTASGVDEALLAYKSFIPDVIVTDIKMPGRDGIDLIKEIKLLDKATLFIVMTGQDNHKVLKQLKDETGIEDYLTKPFGVDEMDALIEKIFRMLKSRK